jgi:lipopolysaccharide/colanic/teichoic acid biosynthesis glycosyltransferase
MIIKLTSRGPIISKLSKVGWRGRQIKVYRFRTTHFNTNKRSTYPESKIKASGSEFDKDPRLTKIGRFLLKSGLDQLPELFNVLEGEMSVIGPRHPLQSDIIKSFKRKYS